MYRVDSQKLIELSQSALLKSLIGRRHSNLTRAGALASLSGALKYSWLDMQKTRKDRKSHRLS